MYNILFYMTNITTADFEKGIFIEFKGEPHQIVDTQFVNPGKGSAFVRTKLKNVKSGRVQEFTYKSGESAIQIPIEVHEMQYLYKENESFVFMDNRSFEQTKLPKDILGNFSQYVKEGEIYQIFIHEGEGFGMRIPKKVRLAVTEAEEAVKGSTMMGAKKLVTVETGAQIAVPIFIKNGDVIVVDPQSNEYVSRESQD